MIIQGNNLQYQLEKKLGKGTYGTTYLAAGSDGQYYAVKKFRNFHNFIDLGYSENKAQIKVQQANKDREFEEATLGAILSICQQYATCFIESINFQDNIFIVMSLIDGISVEEAIFKKLSLQDRIDRGQKFIKDLVNGLHSLHNLGLIHQDIKSENLIYNPQTDSTKFIDFGLSCLVNNAVKVGGLQVFGMRINAPCGSIGTITTAPPEMFEHDQDGTLLVNENDDPIPDEGIYPVNFLTAHDIWSIACVILHWYIRWSSSVEFGPMYTEEFATGRMVKQFHKVKQYDPIAYNVLCRLMDRDPIMRIQNFQDVYNYYNGWFSSLPEYLSNITDYNITVLVRNGLIHSRCNLTNAFSYDQLDITPEQCQ